MKKDEQYRIVPSESKTELQKFAFWFHQDWELIFSDFYEGAKMYLESLSPSRRSELKSELEQFLDLNANSSPSELKKAWLSLGAQGWQANLDIRKTLWDFVGLM